ncbi:MAG: polymer-forming cytoskeletal protein [Erysipelotrichaceae bacterium]|nr:polymer-forming cytoskeletal protein [Erysipelotrichaceae bacterium]
MNNDESTKKSGWFLAKPKPSDEDGNNDLTKSDIESNDEVEDTDGVSSQTGSEKGVFELFKNTRAQDVKQEIKLSIIHQDVVITGDIKASGNIELYGTITGNVDCGDLIVKHNGRIEGNVTARALTVLSAEFKGNIECSKNATIHKDAIINGDIVAENILCEGKINGNVSVSDFLELRASASINGDCSFDTIAIEKGGMVNGSLKVQKR